MICTNKKCVHCGKDQPISNFSKNKKSKTGYNNWCKDCMKKYQKGLKATQGRKIYYEKNKKSILKKKRINSKKFAEYEKYYNKICIYDEVRRDPQNLNLLQIRCAYCGKWFNPTRTQVQQRIKYINGKNQITKDGRIRTHGESKFYCSKECKNSCPAFHKKEWFEGKCPTHKYETEVNSEFRKMIFQEDNYTCLFCGTSKNDNPNLILHCHHILPKASNPINSCDIDNAITVCKECHIWIHTHIEECKYHKICKK